MAKELKRREAKSVERSGDGYTSKADRKEEKFWWN